MIKSFIKVLRLQIENDKYSTELKKYTQMRNYCINPIREAMANYRKLEFQRSNTFFKVLLEFSQQVQ